MTETKITIRLTLSTSAGLRTMAAKALEVRDEMDGVSASQYTSWNNVAAALLAQADALDEDTREREHADLHRLVPTRRKTWQGPLTRVEAEAREALGWDDA